ncbi:MAG: hypothetical protein ACOCXS_02045 [Bacteroidota bacterium]
MKYTRFFQCFVLGILSSVFLLLVSCDGGQGRRTDQESRQSVYTFGNDDFMLEITKTGGMFVRFEKTDNPVNPFGWRLRPDEMPENNRPHVFAGHFLCSGRWGAPSRGEIEAGIPHNGEVNTQPWHIEKEFYDLDKQMLVIEMKCEAPIEKLNVTRRIFVPDDDAFYVVKEEFINDLPVGRLVNFVQHPTVSEPFLDSEMIVRTNAGKGFDQKTSLSGIEDSCFTWPQATLSSGEKVNLTNSLTNTGFVTSHVFDKNDEFGWCFAYNPNRKLLFGYIFDTSDYPWFNYWHHAEDGQPVVRGLEFGTTGFGEDYGKLLGEDVSFNGDRGVDFLDAGDSVVKSYLSFQASCPSDDFWFDESEDNISVKCKQGDKIVDIAIFEKAVLNF